MGRNTQIADRLRKGETVQYRPHGNSMTPKVKSGQLVTVEPATLEDPAERQKGLIGGLV